MRRLDDTHVLLPVAKTGSRWAAAHTAATESQANEACENWVARSSCGLYLLNGRVIKSAARSTLLRSVCPNAPTRSRYATRKAASRDQTQLTVITVSCKGKSGFCASKADHTVHVNTFALMKKPFYVLTAMRSSVGGVEVGLSLGMFGRSGMTKIWKKLARASGGLAEHYASLG